MGHNRECQELGASSFAARGAARVAALAWGQQPREAADHRVLGRGTSSATSQWAAAFVQRLRELGWIEGLTFIEYRWAEGCPPRSVEIATEFVRLKVDVIVTYATHQSWRQSKRRRLSRSSSRMGPTRLEPALS